MALKSWADVVHMSEEFEPESHKFRYTTVAAIDSEDSVYYEESPFRKAEISPEHILPTLRPIYDRDVYPEWPSVDSLDITKFVQTTETPPVTGQFFVKRPNLALYDVFKRCNSTYPFAQNLLEEARAMQFLSEHLHPHIIRYHGCCSRRGYLTGIVLDHYSNNLHDYLKNKVGTININVFMGALESAMRHLHSLGWAHNDLTPKNILDYDSDSKGGLPVVIDFGSAGEIGRLLGLSRGTSGWIEGQMQDYTHSKKEHDMLAIAKIRAWLENPIYDKTETVPNDSGKKTSMAR